MLFCDLVLFFFFYGGGIDFVNKCVLGIVLGIIGNRVEVYYKIFVF